MQPAPALQLWRTAMRLRPCSTCSRACWTQYYVAWTASDASAGAASLAWINGLQAQLDQHIPPNSYLNYLDANVTGGAQAYYTGSFSRMQAVKAKYDPTNFFNYPASIPLPQA